MPTRAGGPHRKNEPLQRTARPSDALPATVRPRRRLSCTLVCHYQVTPAQSKPARTGKPECVARRRQRARVEEVEATSLLAKQPRGGLQVKSRLVGAISMSCRDRQHHQNVNSNRRPAENSQGSSGPTSHRRGSA